MSVGIGDRAPDFTLPGPGGEEVSLSDFAGRPVVLVFYPGDDSPVCTKQLNAYNDGLDQFGALRASRRDSGFPGATQRAASAP